MFIGALVKMLPAPRRAIDGDSAGYYGQLVHSVFKPGNVENEKTAIVVLTSASRGAGTSFIAREIGMELARYGGKKTAIVDARRLERISKPDLEKWAKLSAIAESGVFWLKDEEAPLVNNKLVSKKKASPWQSSVTFRQDCLQLLRRYFNHVLIDCHSASVSSPLTLLAELVDGVVIVAAAGQTRRDEIQRAERVVEMAQGKVLGFVLNKRKYPIPGWLYKNI